MTTAADTSQIHPKTINPSWLTSLRGRFVVFDGPDGSGKSTQFHHFAHFVREHSDVVVCEVREPGGTVIGEQIRRVLLDPANSMMNLRTEMLLYMASRAQLVQERIIPALKQQEFVLADRFISSTLAYQGTAGGIGFDEIRHVAQVACREAQPDCVIIFDVDQATAAHRLNPLLDRMEAKGQAFHQRVREGYLRQAQDEPQRYLVIDARPPAEDVWNSLINALSNRFAIRNRRS